MSLLCKTFGIVKLLVPNYIKVIRVCGIDIHVFMLHFIYLCVQMVVHQFPISRPIKWILCFVGWAFCILLECRKLFVVFSVNNLFLVRYPPEQFNNVSWDSSKLYNWTTFMAKTNRSLWFSWSRCYVFEWSLW